MQPQNHYSNALVRYGTIVERDARNVTDLLSGGIFGAEPWGVWGDVARGETIYLYLPTVSSARCRITLTMRANIRQNVTVAYGERRFTMTVEEYYDKYVFDVQPDERFRTVNITPSAYVCPYERSKALPTTTAR